MTALCDPLWHTPTGLHTASQLCPTAPTCHPTGSGREVVLGADVIVVVAAAVDVVDVVVRQVNKVVEDQSVAEQL